MTINTYYIENYEKLKQRLIDEGHLNAAERLRPWNADIDGPWYDDSNPEGKGFTKEEAINNAVAEYRKRYKEMGEFLKEYPE